MGMWFQMFMKLLVLLVLCRNVHPWVIRLGFVRFVPAALYEAQQQEAPEEHAHAMPGRGTAHGQRQGFFIVKSMSLGVHPHVRDQTQI